MKDFLKKTGAILLTLCACINVSYASRLHSTKEIKEEKKRVKEIERIESGEKE